ncbi:MAG: hypothetical protein WA159_01395 [Variovorax sp.]
MRTGRIWLAELTQALWVRAGPAAFMLMAAAYGNAYGATMCDVPIQELEAADADLSANGLPKDVENAQVVLVGEQHFITPLEAPLLLVESFAKAHPVDACLTFELPSVVPTVDGLLQVFESMLTKRKSMARPSAQERAHALDLEDILDYFRPIHQAAKEANLKMFAIDTTESNQSVDQRSELMSRRIATLVRTRECANVLSIVGKSHLAEDEHNKVNMRTVLRAANVKAVSVNMQPTNESGNYPNFLSFNPGCPKARKVSGFAWIANEKLKTDPLLWPRNDTSATYRQLDFTFFVPSHLALRREKTR